MSMLHEYIRKFNKTYPLLEIIYAVTTNLDGTRKFHSRVMDVSPKLEGHRFFYNHQNNILVLYRDPTPNEDSIELRSILFSLLSNRRLLTVDILVPLYEWRKL